MAPAAARDLLLRAAAAEAEAEALRLRLVEVSVPPVVVVASQEAMEGMHASDTTPEANKPVQGLWRRLRRAWRGA